jgi:hypothetical protein
MHTYSQALEFMSQQLLLIGNGLGGQKRPRSSTQSTLTSFLSARGPTTAHVVGDAKPYKCCICNNSFLSNSGLATHMAFHSQRSEYSRTSFGPGKDHGPALAEPPALFAPAHAAFLSEQSEREVEIVDMEEVLLSDDEDEDGEEEPDEKSSSAYGKRMTIAQKIQVLDKYYELKENKSATARWVIEHFKRDTYDLKNIRDLLEKEKDLRQQAGKKAVKKFTVSRDGLFPQMEKALAKSIREQRAAGIPVELGRLKILGLVALQQTNPGAFAANTFTFSSTWKTSFMKRHGFSLRRATTTNASLLDMPAVIAKIKKFHLRARLLQMKALNDPTFGFCNEKYVYNRDEVPIELLSDNKRTLDEKGADVVWTALGSETDSKRFCTLNLMVPMKVDIDEAGEIKNLPLPHVVFKATNFCDGNDWDAEEVKLWHPNVIVSFQKNAWVDTETNLFFTEKVVAPLNNKLITQGVSNAVCFEDNLGSHHTSSALDAWKVHASLFTRAEFEPNLTHDLQPIDHHIGIQYKNMVYSAVMDHYYAAIAANKANPTPLNAKEKRILVTHAIGKAHAAMARKDGFRSSFIATGTWVPLDHSEDNLIKMQNTKGYDYKTNINDTTIEEEKARLVLLAQVPSPCLLF